MDTTTTPTTHETPQPVQSKERVVLLDVIRGFALGGVFFSNVFLWFNGRFLFPPTYWKSYTPGAVEAASLWAFRYLVSGRFITIFSFLFGLGISMQFMRAESSEDSPAKRYTRRALVMLLFAAIHVALIWYGDILHVYAIAGFGLLLFRRASTKTLIIVGGFLALLAGPIGQWIEQFVPHLWTSAEVLKQQQEARMTEMATANAQMLTLLESHSYVDIVRANLLVYWHHFARWNVIGFYVALVGNFLLGFAAGRVNLFGQVDKYRRLFWHTLGWGLVAEIVGGVGMFILRNSGPGKDYFKTNETIVPLFAPIAREVQTLGLAAFYVAAIALLFQRPWGQRFLSIYAPVGRMAVTNYLSQSVICLFIFTGIGLGKMENVSATWSILMPAVVFPIQMVASWLWLKRFSFGPIEWLWRTMTYGKRLTMKTSPAAIETHAEGPRTETVVASTSAV